MRNYLIHSVKELVENDKANPGQLSFASGYTAGIVGGYTLSKWGEFSTRHVPYKTTGPGASGHHRWPRVDDVRRFHLRHAEVRSRDRAPGAILLVYTAARFIRSCRPTDEAGIKGFDLDALGRTLSRRQKHSQRS